MTEEELGAAGNGGKEKEPSEEEISLSMASCSCSKRSCGDEGVKGAGAKVVTKEVEEATSLVVSGSQCKGKSRRENGAGTTTAVNEVEENTSLTFSRGQFSGQGRNDGLAGAVAVTSTSEPISMRLRSELTRGDSEPNPELKVKAR